MTARHDPADPPAAPPDGPAHWPALAKPAPRAGRPAPNLRDYDAERRAFTWGAARSALDGLPGGRGLHIAHEAVDRHAAGAARVRVALRCLARDGTRRDLRFAELAEATNRFANAVRALGLRRGDRVFALAPRIPTLYVAALGALKAGCVFCPLFSAFGPEPIRQRLQLGHGRLLVTTASLYRRKLAPLRASLPGLAHVALVEDEPLPPDAPGLHGLEALVAAASPRFEIEPTDPEQPALLHFTSGTTGMPKGALHVHDAVVAHHATAAYALDFHPADIFWCTADPGWVTGTSDGIVAPLSHGITSLVDESESDAEHWYRVLAEERVTVWYTAPTAVRMLMKAGPELARRFDLSALRFVASVGEPLHPEAVIWGRDVLGGAVEYLAAHGA